MKIRKYEAFFTTFTGPGRPFAKQYYDKPIEDVLHAWKGQKQADGSIPSFFYYIDDNLMELDRVGGAVTLSFSDDWHYCVMRMKYIPEGNVRERFELGVLELKSEVDLTPEDDAYITRLKQFRTLDYQSRLCRIPEDLEAVLAVAGIQGSIGLYPHETQDPVRWELNFGPLTEIMDREVISYRPPTRRYPTVFERVVRAAIYVSDNVDDALALANDVLENCGCGRRLSDEELRSFNVDMEWYNRVWPRVYMGERNGYYFIVHDDYASMTNLPEDFSELKNEVEERAYWEAAFSGGGLHKCGGIRV